MNFKLAVCIQDFSLYAFQRPLCFDSDFFYLNKNHPQHPHAHARSSISSEKQTFGSPPWGGGVGWRTKIISHLGIICSINLGISRLALEFSVFKWACRASIFHKNKAAYTSVWRNSTDVTVRYLICVEPSRFNTSEISTPFSTVPLRHSCCLQ